MILTDEERERLEYEKLCFLKDKLCEKIQECQTMDEFKALISKMTPDNVRKFLRQKIEDEKARYETMRQRYLEKQAELDNYKSEVSE